MAVSGSEIDLAQALDNLINNAIEHGCGRVTVEGREAGDRLRLTVRNSHREAPTRREREQPGLRQRVGGRHRHGHGLRVVARTAAEHGGSFRLLRSKHSTEARLKLPLHDGGAER